MQNKVGVPGIIERRKQAGISHKKHITIYKGNAFKTHLIQPQEILTEKFACYEL